MRLLEFATSSQEVQEEGELIVAELGQLRFTRLRDRPPDRLHQLEGVRGDLHHDPAAIGLAVNAPCIARALQAIQGGGHRAPAQAACRRELAGCRGPVAIEPAHAAKIGRIQAQDVGGSLVDCARRALGQGDLASDPLHQVV